MKEPLTVVKVGGNVIDDEQALEAFLHDFAALNGKKILVHGGGKLATRMAEQLGIAQQMMNGRRITDAETLKIVTMVYAGYINKNIVAKLQALDCNAIGLTGADANVVPATKRPVKDGVDYGFVGDVTAPLSTRSWQIFMHTLTPVVAAITHDGKGNLLNTNADTMAQEIAKAMSSLYSVQLVYLFEKPGVLRNAADDNSVIPAIDFAYYRQLKAEKVIFEGMIPKMDNAFEALQNGVCKVMIGHAGALQKLINGQAGTSITHD